MDYIDLLKNHVRAIESENTHLKEEITTLKSLLSHNSQETITSSNDNVDIQGVLDKFLVEFYGHSKTQLAVQKSRWKKRINKDPQLLKSSDLSLYNLLMFASGMKQEQTPDPPSKKRKKIRRMSKLFVDGMSVRHKKKVGSDYDIWITKYSKSTDTLINLNDDTQYKSMRSFCIAHYMKIEPNKRYIPNAWDECEYFVDNQWITIASLESLP